MESIIDLIDRARGQIQETARSNKGIEGISRLPPNTDDPIDDPRVISPRFLNNAAEPISLEGDQPVLQPRECNVRYRWQRTDAVLEQKNRQSTTANCIFPNCRGGARSGAQYRCTGRCSKHPLLESPCRAGRQRWKLLSTRHSQPVCATLSVWSRAWSRHWRTDAAMARSTADLGFSGSFRR